MEAAIRESLGTAQPCAEDEDDPLLAEALKASMEESEGACPQPGTLRPLLAEKGVDGRGGKCMRRRTVSHLGMHHAHFFVPMFQPRSRTITPSTLTLIVHILSPAPYTQAGGKWNASPISAGRRWQRPGAAAGTGGGRASA